MTLVVTEPLWLQYFEMIDEDTRDGVPDGWRSRPAVNSACEFAALPQLAEEAQYLVGRYENFDALIAANPPTSIHHLYHLTRWSDETGVAFDDIRTVIEWGGGYGSLARLLLLLNPSIAYTVIDHPVMLRLHEHFLPDGRVRRVPLDQVDEVADGCDLFVSTWALSESGEAAQDYVVESRGWFEAAHLLLAYNEEGFEGSAHFTDLTRDLPHQPTTIDRNWYVLR